MLLCSSRKAVTVATPGQYQLRAADRLTDLTGCIGGGAKSEAFWSINLKEDVSTCGEEKDYEDKGFRKD